MTFSIIIQALCRLRRFLHPVFALVFQLDIVWSTLLFEGFTGAVHPSHYLSTRKPRNSLLERLFDVRKVHILKTIFSGYHSPHIITHLISVCMYVDVCMVCWESKELKFDHFFLPIAQGVR